jgi:hypothetical protein
MGYTHYFHYHKASLSLEDWNTLTNAVKLLVAALPEHSDSAGGYYKDAPLKLDADTVISRDQIAFNGDGEDEKGENLSHETFVLDRSWRKELKAQKRQAVEDGQHHLIQYYDRKLAEKVSGEFTKTERKPYDLLVCAVLATAQHLFHGWIVVTSDGEREDWASACAWARKVTGYDVQVPHSVKPRLGGVENGQIQVLDGVVQS